MPVSVDFEIAVALNEEGDDTIWFCYDLPATPPALENPSAVFQFEVPDARDFLGSRDLLIDRFVPEPEEAASEAGEGT